MGNKGQVTGVRQLDQLGLGNHLNHLRQSFAGYEKVSTTSNQLGGDPDLLKAISQVDLLGELKAVSHDALVGAPALAGHEVKELPTSWAAAKEQIEELVHEG